MEDPLCKLEGEGREKESRSEVCSGVREAGELMLSLARAMLNTAVRVGGAGEEGTEAEPVAGGRGGIREPTDANEERGSELDIEEGSGFGSSCLLSLTSVTFAPVGVAEMGGGMLRLLLSALLLLRLRLLLRLPFRLLLRRWPRLPMIRLPVLLLLLPLLLPFPPLLLPPQLPRRPLLPPLLLLLLLLLLPVPLLLPLKLPRRLFEPPPLLPPP